MLLDVRTVYSHLGELGRIRPPGAALPVLRYAFTSTKSRFLREAVQSDRVSASLGNIHITKLCSANAPLPADT